MAYPGVRESVLQTLLSTMQSNVGTLNTALSGVSPALLASVTVTSDFFGIGDIERVPDVGSFPFWVTLESGGKQDGTDADIELYASGGTKMSTYYTNVYFYIHPDAFPQTSTAFATVRSQASSRTLLRSRFHDWLISVLGNAASQALTLGSQTYNPGTYDILQECRFSSVRDGFIEKSFGGTMSVFMSHFTHIGKIYGAT